jgi:hypothetical protein
MSNSTRVGLPKLLSLTSNAPVVREVFSSTMVAVKAALGSEMKRKMFRNESFEQSYSHYSRC